MLVNVFLGGTLAAYTLAAGSHVFHIYLRDWEGMARWSTRIAWVLHTFTAALVTLDVGHLPVRSLFEALLSTTWLLMLAYLIWEGSLNNQAPGAFLLPSVFLLLLGAILLPRPGDGPVDLDTRVLVWHVSVTLLAYALFTASFICALMYLLQEKQLRDKAFHAIYHRLPPLERLDFWGHRFVHLGFPMLTLGLVVGFSWALTLWNEPDFRATDPKVLWSVFIWLVYGGYLWARRRNLAPGRAAWWSLFGFGSIVVNYFVINIFLSGFHRFGL